MEPNSAPQSNSGLTTYRDSDSGRLIVRIFDKETGDVLLEFPPEDPPGRFRGGAGPDQPAPQHDSRRLIRIRALSPPRQGLSMIKKLEAFGP